MEDRKKRRMRKRRRQFRRTCFSWVFLLCIFAAAVIVTIKYSSAVKNNRENGSGNTEVTENLQNDIEVTEIICTEDNIKNQEDKSQEVLNDSSFNIELEYERIVSLQPGEMAVNGILSGELMGRMFFEGDINQILPRIQGISYVENPNIDLSDLAYLRMLYYGSDGNTYVGEMIVNQKIKDLVLSVFQQLYENRYPIERMVLIDNYNGEDEASMEANNTSAFNYRTIAGSSKLSNHSYGMAIDLNPKYNPYVKTASDGSVICQPESGRDYIDRTKEFDYKIDENDLAYRLFTEAGFSWGGNWNSVKDYQHFEMVQ